MGRVQGKGAEKGGPRVRRAQRGRAPPRANRRPHSAWRSRTEAKVGARAGERCTPRPAARLTSTSRNARSVRATQKRAHGINCSRTRGRRGRKTGGASCALRRGSRAPRARASKAAAGARPTRAQARAHGELGDRLGDFKVESLDQRDFQGETPQAVALVRVVKRGLERGNVLWARADTYELLVRVAVLLQSRHPRFHRLVPEILIRLGDFELEAFSVPLKVIRFIMSSRCSRPSATLSTARSVGGS